MHPKRLTNGCDFGNKPSIFIILTNETFEKCSIFPAKLNRFAFGLVHNQSSENIAKLLGFLKSIDAFHRRPDDKMIRPKEEYISGIGDCWLLTVDWKLAEY